MKRVKKESGRACALRYLFVNAVARDDTSQGCSVSTLRGIARGGPPPKKGKESLSQ